MQLLHIDLKFNMQKLHIFIAYFIKNCYNVDRR